MLVKFVDNLFEFFVDGGVFFDFGFDLVEEGGVDYGGYFDVG